MANPPGMKVLTVDIHTWPALKISCFFVFYVLCNRCRSYSFRIAGSMMVRSWGRNQEGRFVSGPRSSELSALLDENSLVSLVIITKWMSFIESSGPNGWVCVEDSRGRRPRELLVCT